MQVLLKENKITLSDVPNNNVPKALLIICKNSEQIFTDVIAGKQTYKLPSEIKIKDILAVYLRVH